MKDWFRGVLLEINPITCNYTYTVRGGLAKGFRRKGGFGFIPRSNTTEEDFLLQQDLQSKVVFDVGGNSGMYSLFFASKVGDSGTVYTFEPNPLNQKEIHENVQLNQFKNITVFGIGLAASSGKATLTFNPLGRATGSFNEEIRSNLKRTQKKICEISVDLDTIDNMVEQGLVKKPDFIKVDVEGLEMDVLKGAKNTLHDCEPELFIEVHGANVQHKMSNAKQLLNYLDKYDYSMFHVESSSRIKPSDYQTAMIGHIFASKNQTQ
jgi:FkbM family methyltransferase